MTTPASSPPADPQGAQERTSDADYPMRLANLHKVINEQHTEIVRLRALAASSTPPPADVGADQQEDAERTVASIAAMLGWGNVPPRETLEADIRALKARALSAPSGVADPPRQELETALRELVDVTSISRIDEHWTFTDAAGHVHRWHEVGNPEPVTAYRPEWAYEVPTLKYVVDETGIDEDGYEYERGHSECLICGEHVTPGRTADTTQQMIPGLRWYRINGQSVTPEEFQRRAKLATGNSEEP